jgi:lipid-binding SYLF domain-containing protein
MLFISAAIGLKSNRKSAPIFAEYLYRSPEKANSRRPASIKRFQKKIFMKRTSFLTTIVFTLGLLTSISESSRAASAAEIDQSAKAALNSLYASSPAAQSVGKKAKAVLVFPRILKAGFVAGVQRGDGALIVNGKSVAYYNTVAASYGLQAGVQKFGYAMFFMTNASLAYLHKSGGWEVGTAPSLVVVDTGIARSLSTTTLKKGIYVFFFGQKGLMAGFGLQGTKITQYTPSK